MNFIVLLALLGALVAAAPAPTENAAALLGMAPTERRLIKTAAETPAQWLGARDILALHRAGTHFMDVTETPDMDQVVSMVTAPAVPTQATQQAVVKPIIARGTVDLMRSTLEKLTSFNTRYYRSATGAESADWLFGHVKAIVAANNNAGLNVTVTQMTHSFAQKSIILRIEGRNNNQETVIVGAHLDSILQSNPMSGRSPGADDDGSGTATILEALRMLLVAGYQPVRPVEFQWYAGEEGGLLGSQAIAQSYQRAQRVVAGMLQLDMTMYPTKSRKDIGIVTDYTDDRLNKLLKVLVPTYTSVAYGEFACRYGCSDHASWNRAGFPSAMPFESSNMSENRKIHTTGDTIDTLDFAHGLELAKLAVAFVVEMSQV